MLTLVLGIGATIATNAASATVSASDKKSSDTTQEKLPPWERRPEDMQAAIEANKRALQLITDVFEARRRRSEVEAKFRPKIGPPDKNDPLSGPNDLAVAPLLQDFGQGAVWLSAILTAKETDLSPRLQEVQRGILEGLQLMQPGKPGQVKKEIKKPVRIKDVEKSDTAQEIQRVLQAERNFQEVVSQVRAAFPKYAELYLHQSPRVLNKPGVPTVFELCDPAVNADPIEKGERMQASLVVTVHRYDEHSFKIVSFWLYRNIEDPDIFVPRSLYSEKGADLTRNYLGRWDWNHMPPRTFSSIGYVSQAVTVMTLKFIDGELVITGRGVPAGRRRVQPVNLAGLNLNQLEPAREGVLDASGPSFPVIVPEIPKLPPLALKNPRPGRDYMPRIREPYEFLTHAEYEAYMTGIREGLAATEQPPNEPMEPAPPEKTEPSTAAAVPVRGPGAMPSHVPANIAVSPTSAEQMNAIFLNPRQEGGLSELSILARESLKQYSDLQPVSSGNLINLLFGKSNAGFRAHDQPAELLRQKLPKVRQVNVYFFASENTTASWRGPDDASGKGGIVVVLPRRHYFDPQEFYRSVAGALINQPVTSPDVAALTNYLAGAAAFQTATSKQFTIETDYLDHGWDENGDMRRWTDEAVDFFKHLQEAIIHLKPRLAAMEPDKKALLDPEISAVEGWLNSLGEGNVTVNFGLYQGKGDAPPPKVDSATRTIWISSKADEYKEAEQREHRWPLLAKLIEGLNGLKGGRFDPAITGAIYDVLASFGKDKDNKLMIAWRLNTDLPAKPAEWPKLPGVSRAPTSSLVAPPPQAESQLINVVADAAGSDRVATGSPTAPPGFVSGQTKTTELAQAPQPKSPIAVAQPVLQEPTLVVRQPQAVQPARTLDSQQAADPEFAKKVSTLIGSQMKGVDDSSLRAKILQTMMDHLIIVCDGDPNFHSKVSSIDLREPSPKHFDFTVNKTEYFDALFTLPEKDAKAGDVAWSSFEANLTTVEYAVGNHDFGPLHTTLQSNLSSIVKRHTNPNGSAVSQVIFDDPQFKALLPYYTAFWSNWQFAGERARFQYLHDHVTSKRLRQLANEAGKNPDTKSLKPDLLRLADDVDLFYGESIQVATALPAVEAEAGRAPNSLDTASISREPERESNKGILKPWEKPDYNFTQVLTMLQKTQQPERQRSQYQDNYRRAFIIYQMLDAWNRMDPGKTKKVLAGEWAGSDIRFVLPILAEIHAKRLSTPLDSSAIVKLSGDMPWIADPTYDLTNGALGRLPETLKSALSHP